MISANAIAWLQNILTEKLGLSISIESNNHTYILKKIGHKNEIAILSNSIFYQTKQNLPFATWDAKIGGWEYAIAPILPAPGVDSLPNPLIEFTDNKTLINYDILGLTYWMLNRIEEIDSEQLDQHQRFPATSSHAFKYGYLERPIVDEWHFILGQIMAKTWGVQIKQSKFNMKVSHDVDVPSIYAFKSWKAIIRMMAADLIKRKKLKSLFTHPINKLQSKHGFAKNDPYNTFDWLMTNSEQQGLTSAFYFICGRTAPERDADYEIEHPLIKKLMREIHSRGHEIGLHPSFGSYLQPSQIKKEADRLRNLLKELEIPTQIGGRMHYLRWSHPITMQAWADAGMLYDTTLGYADLPGFRCGTCFEYRAFNHLTQQQLNLTIRPLIVMECTVIDKRYMNLGYSDKAVQCMLHLKQKCQKVGGTFTLLWHNSHFLHKEDFKLYQKVLEG